MTLASDKHDAWDADDGQCRVCGLPAFMDEFVLRNGHVAHPACAPSFEQWMADEFMEGPAVADALRRYADRGRDEFLEVLKLAGDVNPPTEWKLPVVLVTQRGAVVQRMGRR